MDFAEVVRRRRMVRAFRPDPIPPDVLDRVLGAARRAPAAGNSDGTDLSCSKARSRRASVLGHHVAADLRRASGSGTRGCSTRPCSPSSLADADAYVRRYAEPDKAASGLGASPERWPVPYWTVDASFAAMLVLLAATNEGLGALFFGIFHHETSAARARRADGTAGDRHHRAGLARHRSRRGHPGRSAARPRSGRPRADGATCALVERDSRPPCAALRSVVGAR